MAFYEYNQNNSGGTWIVNKKVCHRLFIESNSKSEADAKAEELGMYFDGVTEGSDCECCGDRWSPAGKESEFPLEYGGLSKIDVERFAAKYKVEARPMKKTAYLVKGREWALVFTAIEQYARYLADEYGWTKPDCRIYYANGAVLEIDSDTKKQ